MEAFALEVEHCKELVSGYHLSKPFGFEVIPLVLKR